MQLLRDNQLYAKLNKYEFWLEQIAFLGHIIFKDGLSVDPSKIEAVASWKRPSSVTEIRSYFGISKLLSEICPRVFIHCSAIDKIDPEGCAICVD